ncbi:MAG: hypothetical protein Alpg2KO_08110 [Alphaproteobacteria bacterium]
MNIWKQIKDIAGIAAAIFAGQHTHAHHIWVQTVMKGDQGGAGFER